MNIYTGKTKQCYPIPITRPTLTTTRVRDCTGKNATSDFRGAHWHTASRSCISSNMVSIVRLDIPTTTCVTDIFDPFRRCNKHYMANQSVVPPGGEFTIPAVSDIPLLAFRCAAAIKPYLEEDVGTPAGVLIDSPVVYSEIVGVQPIGLPAGPLSSAGQLDVTVSLNGKTLVNALVPLNASAYELSFSLDGITPQMTPYNLSCGATFLASNATSSSSPQSYNASAALSVLPNPTNSSVTKMDLRTGALLVKPATGLGGEYEPIFPVGFYTTFDGYLSTNISVVDTLKQQG